MLTRLQVSGFKNLVDVDVRFGPFTCVVGPNGAGKSNLFDAIRFLSALANHTLMEAAASVRDQDSRTADARNLFHRVGDRHSSSMIFSADMIVPRTATDDLGQEADATITFLRYTLRLAYRDTGDNLTSGALEIIKEELRHIAKGDAPQHLLFPHKKSTWRDTVIHGQRFGRAFISTDGDGLNRVIALHQDGGSSGRPLKRPAARLPRTVLSAANAAESPTVVVARREMQSWRILQLEPSALRKPDDFAASTRLGTDGDHLPATLYRLARNAANEPTRATTPSITPPTYSRIANRLGELIHDVSEIYVDRDEKREILTLFVKDAARTDHPARALSDGTLRFLALAVVEMDPELEGVLCLEEPENGIHPARIPAILRLLRDIAMDVMRPVGPDNPLRQVIVNTHSPAVFQQVPDGSVVFTKVRETIDTTGKLSMVAHFCPLANTWRSRDANSRDVVARGELLDYLRPVVPGRKRVQATERRVIDRDDIRPLLPLGS